MEIRWMKRKNKSGNDEKFYPITHVDAIVGLSDIDFGDLGNSSDLTDTELADTIAVDVPEIPVVVQNSINNLNDNLQTQINNLDNSLHSQINDVNTKVDTEIVNVNEAITNKLGDFNLQWISGDAITPNYSSLNIGNTEVARFKQNFNSDDYKNAIIAGESIYVTLDMSKTGTYSLDFTAAPSTYQGKSLIGYHGRSSTYRVCIIGFGSDRLYYYVGTTHTTSVTAEVIPLYR